jgi:hypothetical protein
MYYGYPSMLYVFELTNFMYKEKNTLYALVMPDTIQNLSFKKQKSIFTCHASSISIMQMYTYKTSI